MSTDDTIARWQQAILAQAEARLGRSLVDRERQLITRLGSLIALEMVEDTVRSSSTEELSRWFAAGVARLERGG